MSDHTKFQRRCTIANDDISFDIEYPMDYTNDNFSNSDNMNSSTSSSNDDYLVQQGILSDVAAESFLPRQWRIKDEDVTELPEIYPRLSSPLIIRDCEISKIGDSLFDFLKVNSVRSVYDSQRARIFCYTKRASFVVQFWRRKIHFTAAAANTASAAFADEKSTKREIDGNNITQSEEEVILEVQRRQGCSYAMHKIRTALKKSILPQSSSFSSSRCSNSSTSRPMVRYERLILQHQNRPFKRPSVEEMTMIRKRMRWSKFLPPLPRTIAPRQQTITNIGSIDMLVSNNSTSPRHRRSSSSGSIDSLINKSIFVAAASSDPSTLDDINNASTSHSTLSMVE